VPLAAGSADTRPFFIRPPRHDSRRPAGESAGSSWSRTGRSAPTNGTAAYSFDSPLSPWLYRAHNKNQKQGPEMKRLLFAGTLVLATTAAQAQNTTSNPNSHPVQAYTSIGPAGAGAYRESSQ
jgi:hypothetical protein